MVVAVDVGEAAVAAVVTREEVVVTRAVVEEEVIAEAAAIEGVAGPRMQEAEAEYECPRGEDRVSHPWEDSAP